MGVNRIMPGRLALQMAKPSTGQTVVVPVVDPNAAQRSADAASMARAANIAAYNELVSYGTDSVVDMTNTIFNPVDPTGVLPPPAFPIVTLVIPMGLVFVLRKIGVTYSNPLIAMSQAVGWRVTVNTHRVPWIFQTTDDYFYNSNGTVSNPIDIEPLVVQSGSVLALVAYPRFLFNNLLVLSGRISGKLVKPANPNATGF